MTTTIRFWRAEHPHPRAALIGAIIGAVLWTALWGFAAHHLIVAVVDVRSPRVLLALCLAWASRDYVTAALAEFARRFGVDTDEAERLHGALR